MHLINATRPQGLSSSGKASSQQRLTCRPGAPAGHRGSDWCLQPETGACEASPTRLGLHCTYLCPGRSPAVLSQVCPHSTGRAGSRLAVLSQVCPHSTGRAGSRLACQRTDVTDRALNIKQSFGAFTAAGFAKARLLVANGEFLQVHFH